MNGIIKILTNIGLIGILLLALGVFGTQINNIIQWDWLINFFVIVRSLLKSIDFIIDTNTLITLIGISLYLTVAYWILKATTFVIEWFRH